MRGRAKPPNVAVEGGRALDRKIPTPEMKGPAARRGLVWPGGSGRRLAGRLLPERGGEPRLSLVGSGIQTCSRESHRVCRSFGGPGRLGIQDTPARDKVNRKNDDS